MINKYKRKTIEDLYRVTGKYWNTGDTDYLDAVTKLSKTIDNRMWLEIQSFADLTVHKHASIDALIEALRLFGYEVEEDKEKRETEDKDELSGTV